MKIEERIDGWIWSTCYVWCKQLLESKVKTLYSCCWIQSSEEPSSCIFFRNYNAQKDDRSSSFNSVTFLDAIISSFCSPIHLSFHKINNSLLYDRGIICNNPTLEAIMEARQVFGMNKPFTILSIGTGTKGTVRS